MAKVFGYTTQVDASGNDIVIGQSGDLDGVCDVVVRAASAGVFVGGTNVNADLPSTGFELLPNVEYRFATMFSDLRLATESETPISVSVLLTTRVI